MLLLMGVSVLLMRSYRFRISGPVRLLVLRMRLSVLLFIILVWFEHGLCDDGGD